MLFNSKPINIVGVGGLNDATGIPLIPGTCGTCHDTPNVGHHSIVKALPNGNIVGPLNIGVADVKGILDTRYLPVITLRNKSTSQEGHREWRRRCLATLDGRLSHLWKRRNPAACGRLAGLEIRTGTMRKTSSGRRVPCERERRGGLVMAACVLGGVLAGCGSPASDPASGLESRAATVNTAKVSATKSAELGTQATGQVPAARVSRREDRSDPRDRAPASQPVIAKQSDEPTEERNAALSPDIPEVIIKDLGSPDAQVRYRALDYWETQHEQQPPLTPVFEAMEDEDAGVRAKAATIVERHMDVEQEDKG